MLTAKSAVSELSLSLLGGLMTIRVAAKYCKMPEAKVEFKLICPDYDATDPKNPPTRPQQMYVHPDDLDKPKPRMWTVGECAKARLVDDCLYPVTDEEIEAAKETTLPPGEITIQIFPADQVNTTTRPNGQVYRLAPKAVPHVYGMLVDLVADTTKAYVGEMTIKGVQRMYRLESWNGHLLLQELIRPGEFYDVEDATFDYPAALLAKAQAAAATLMEDFDPVAFETTLRDRAAALDAAKRDPNAPKVVAGPKAKPKDNVEDLMALLDGVVAAKAPTKKAAKVPAKKVPAKKSA